MRELILNAALDLFVREGFEGTTMRRIADEIEYTPGALYSYFKDKDEICYALHTKGFDKLNEMMAQAIAKLPKRVAPLERLRVVGRTYIQFAVDNASLYDLMFISKRTGHMIAENKAWEPGMRAFGTLRETVQMVITKHQLDWNADVVAYTCWSAVHGMVSLILCDRCAPMGDAPSAILLEASYAQFIDMMKASIAARR
ncbi:MAG: TetR/AcrR family transcriptional regulator [Deltaproteobacteria bacterium]|nr:TetR/AcrR family transcriptional regulator [Deltaproteobacteria bacterium]